MGQGLYVTLFCYPSQKLLTKASNYESNPTIRGPIMITTKATTSVFVMGCASIVTAINEHFPDEFPRLFFNTDG